MFGEMAGLPIGPCPLSVIISETGPYLQTGVSPSQAGDSYASSLSTLSFSLSLKDDRL